MEGSEGQVYLFLLLKCSKRKKKKKKRPVSKKKKTEKGIRSKKNVCKHNRTTADVTEITSVVMSARYVCSHGCRLNCQKHTDTVTDTRREKKSRFQA